MPNVERAVHLGIIRTTCALDNIKENVDENMKKARRQQSHLTYLFVFAYLLRSCSSTLYRLHRHLCYILHSLS
jgi:hypothetical protein